MFTGLVEDTGVVVAADRAAGASYGAPELPAGAAVGDRVNLEADILAKHVEKLVKP
jgi:riboflavin synthase alpha subunit